MLITSIFRRLVSRALRLVLLLSAVAALAEAQTSGPSANDGYEPGFDGNVYALALQPDGKLIAGGQFTNFRDRAGFTHRRRNIARINVDGTLDESFDPDASAPVRAILLLADGRIIVGGDFTTLQPNGGDEIRRNRIARLNANGSVDPDFDPNLGGFLQPQVFAIVRQSDGRIVVGGSFTTTQPNGAPAAFERNYLARFNADGSLDQSWEPHPNSMVLSLAIHVDDKLLVGGGFTSFWESGSPEPSNRFRLARLNPNGSLDTEFNMEINNAVNALAVQRDGKILVGGAFTTFKHVTEEGVASRNYLGRINTDGTVDSEFYPFVNGAVEEIAITADGGFLIGGSFTSAWSRGTTQKTRNYVARFHPDGTLDGNFNPGVNYIVSAFAFQPDGKLVMGGYFTRVQPEGAAAGVVRNHLARFNRNGSLDTDFKLEDGGRVLTSVVQSDGRIVIAGSFTNLAGVKHNYMARLNPDGSVDHNYAPDFNGRVYTLAYEAGSGKVVAGGAFTEIGGEPRNGLVRLNPSGTIDSEFNPNINGQVGVVRLQSDGKILVGGSFSAVQPLGYTESVSRSNLLRLNNDGSLDASFDPSPNSSVTTLVLQSDSRILVGGIFTTLTPGVATNTSAATISQGYLARLKPDGTVDADFKPVLNGQLNAIAVQPDGKLILGGAFTNVTGSDGKLVTQTNSDGTTSDVAPTRNRIARLQANGDLDFTYDPNANGSVFAIALLPDGKAVVGGAFTTFQPNGASAWTLRKYAARINVDGSLDESYNLDIGEEPGNRVDSLLLLADGRLLVGGRFTSLQPAGSAARVMRENFARLETNNFVDTTFNPGAGGPTGGVIRALAVQADDKVIAVGDFSDLGGAKTTNIARFRPEGSPDSSFGTTLTANGPVNSVIVRPVSTASASQLSGFAWLDRSGGLLRSFAPGGPARFSGQVRAMARERDGSLLIGGTFSDLSNNFTGNLARFRPDGSLDTGFQPVINGMVSGIAVQDDGRMVVVGSFTTVNGIPRNYIARLDANGSLDVTFDPAANAAINAVIIQDDGKIVVGGTFTTFYLNSTDDDEDDEDNDGEYTDDDDDDDDDNVTRSYLARINSDGTIDSGYYPTPSAAVNALALFPDGKVIIGGQFTTLQPNGGESSFTRYYLARINVDGTLDQNFNPSANGTVHAIVVEPDGQIVVGGEFTGFQPFLGDSTVERHYVARINSDSTVDLFFDPKANGVVRTIALQSDGSLLLGGSFTSLQPNDSDDAIARNYLARVNADGTLDFEYNPDVDSIVYAVVALPDGSALVGGAFSGLQPNGLLVVGGSFSTLGGIEIRNLAMLSDRASVNSSFRPNPNGAVNAVLAYPDGRFIVAGNFTSLAGATRNRLARFNADGELDPTFNPNVNGSISALALQSDGKVLLGGSFQSVGGVARTNLARLNADGSVDSSFAGNSSTSVTALALQGDGRIIYVADATGGRSSLGRLNGDGSADGTGLATSAGVIRVVSLQADGRILISGTFAGLGSAAVSRLVRLNVDFSLDPGFNPAPDGAVTALALQSDGRLMVGGNFSNVGGQPRYGLARLSTTYGATQSLTATPDRGTVTWSRGGTVGDVSAAVFEQSSDGQNWTMLGLGVRVANTGNWQLSGLTLPSTGSFYIRTRGTAPSTAGVASGLYDTLAEFNFAPAVRSVQDGIVPIYAASDSAAALAAEVVPSVYTVVNVSGDPQRAALGGDVSDAIATARLVSLATRANLTSNGTLVMGFTVRGDSARALLVRAIGPGLASLGVNDAVRAPRLQVLDGSGKLLVANDGWNGSATLSAAFAETGAFALPSGSSDAAAVAMLPPGAYSMHIIDGGGSGGSVLAEVYDAATVDVPGSTRLVNLSSRGGVGPGKPLVGGIVLSGNGTRQLLVRAAGPALAKYGVIESLSDPVLSLFDAQGRLLAVNDNWGEHLAELSGAATQVAAFGYDPGSKDAAFIVRLESGAYTVQVAGTAAEAGTTLLEVYELP